VSAPQDNFEASRLEKLHRIEALGLDPWGARLDGHQPIAAIRALPNDLPDGHQPPPPATGAGGPAATVPEIVEDQRPRVRAAGRIILRRGQGKVFFLDLKDWTGRVQVMIGQKQVGETGWALAQELDLGDQLGVEGRFGKTRMGEPTIFAEKIYFLGKSLLPHPDKWSGMQDMEYRLRHRYLDLVYNPETLERARKRILMIRTIRRYLDGQGYYEVETPALHAIAGGAAARPFVTHHNALDIDLFLRIALELPLKRLLVGGMEKVYEIGRVFRNEGIDAKHNPEFTMLELYQAYGDYRTMMDLTEGLIVACVDAIGSGKDLLHNWSLAEQAPGNRKLPYGDAVVDYTPPFRRAAYADLFREHVGVAMDDVEGVRRAAEQTGFPAAGKHHDVLVHHLFEERVEDKLTGPVFVYDYPAALCPLTKRKRDNPAVAERFELYVRGMELANAYTELNDPIMQEATFRQQLAGLPEEESMAKMDEDFVRALRHGMPPAGGLGVGIDRLAMLLTNTQTIRDVILFPLLRPETK
jgi:lysyl-tRNA synthetase, class II